MRPDASPRIAREGAESGPFDGPRLLIVSRRAKAAAVSPQPDRSLDSGNVNPADAGTHKLPEQCSWNMVVKLLPEIHNHACPARMTQAQTWLCHSNSVTLARRSCNSGAPFASTSRGSCNFRLKPPEPGIFRGRSGSPARTHGAAFVGATSISSSRARAASLRDLGRLHVDATLDLLRGDRRHAAQCPGQFRLVHPAIALALVLVE